MALLNKQLGFLFLFEPHTGSRAVLKALQQSHGSTVIGNHHTGMADLIVKGCIQDDLRYKLKVFSTVRNPLDTFITRWVRFPRRRSPNMNAYIRAQQSTDIISNPGLGVYRDAPNLLWFEYLEEDTRRIFGLSLDYDPDHKCKEKRPWNEYFEEDRDSFDRLSRLYAGYCKEFGYGYRWVGDKLFCDVDPQVKVAKQSKIGRVTEWH